MRPVNNAIVGPSGPSERGYMRCSGLMVTLVALCYVAGASRLTCSFAILQPFDSVSRVALQSGIKENSKPTDGKTFEFRRGNAGELETKDGILLDFINYKASDGVDLRVLYTDVNAQLAFDKEIAQAIKIIDRRPKVDGDGKVVGNRAQVLFPPLRQTEPVSAVMWTDGTKFHEIRSQSLPDILKLEKVYRY